MVNQKNSSTKDFYSTSEAASLLGISRVAVFKRIKKGLLGAERVGHAYVIPAKALGVFADGELTDKTKKEISRGVSKVLKEYGETLRLLGKE